MKISDVSKAPSIAKPKAAGAARPVAKAGAAAPVDRISIAGIPDEELTPRVREALSALMEEVRKLRSELEQSRARLGELEQLADADPLVGVLNRRAFVRELNRALAMAERYEAPACLIFADLNDLKRINDEKGHAAGDAALAHVAAVLAANIRQTDVIGRLGGDEFGVILMQTNQETGEEKADTLAARVAESDVAWNGKPFSVRVTCGVVEVQKGASADSALESADSAMYRLKKQR